MNIIKFNLFNFNDLFFDISSLWFNKELKNKWENGTNLIPCILGKLKRNESIGKLEQRIQKDWNRFYIKEVKGKKVKGGKIDVLEYNIFDQYDSNWVYRIRLTYNSTIF